ncbi:MAG: (Fe-S)-binding protein [Desulfobacterales bacterium]|nr:(Fe-S)-binding protein [Desulfobacterales bacterium]
MGSKMDMNTLVRKVCELEDQVVNCTRCGMCQAVCPLFEQTHREADVARGKLSLLTGLMEKVFADPTGVEKRLNHCLLCGSCAANCPSGVNVVEIFIAARAILTEYQGLSPAKQLIFKKMLANPSTFDRLVGWAGKFQGLFTRAEDNAQGTSCARLISPLLAHRHFLPLAPTPLHRELESLAEKNKGLPPSAPKVLFFTGCLIDKVFPTIGHAGVKVLTHHKARVTIPQGQGCCGIPALASGDRETFESLVEHHLDLFEKEKFDVLVTACATCTSTIKKLWPAVYPGGGSRAQALADLAEKTMDINEYLVDVLAPELADSQAGSGSERVTYHDPCHLKKSLGVAAQPRALVRAGGKELVEMAGSDRCCGMGGSFNVYHYDLSSAIGRLKQENIDATQCTTLSTGCPACMMQISDMLAKSGSQIRVKHPVELYAERIDSPED